MRTEPEIMKTARQITIKFISFLGKNLYFVVALFLLHFLYRYLIFRFVPGVNASAIVGLIFDLSFYPIITVFTMYVVKSYYAGKRVDNLQELMDQAKAYFQPLLMYYVIILLIQNIIPMIQPGVSMNLQQIQVILTLIIMIKLAFVDQLIYYRNYGVFDAMRISCKLTTMRVFFLYFVIAIILQTLVMTIVGYLLNSGNMTAQIHLGIQLLILTLVRFFIAVSYRELVKHNFYSAII